MSSPEEDPSNACRFCGRQQLPRDEFNHIKNTLHHLSPPELERRGFCCVCLNEQNILWQLITDHDDIFQMHIVEKLNGSDLKFLGQANSESRLALRRSKNVVTVPVRCFLFLFFLFFLFFLRRRACVARHRTRFCIQFGTYFSLPRGGSSCLRSRTKT